MKQESFLFKQALGLTLFVCLLLAFPSNSYSQTTEAGSNQEEVIRRVRFSGNSSVKDRTLENLVRTKTNREFLGIPRFTPWYFFHRTSNGRFGEEPSLLDRDVVANDMERIRIYYESLGFLEVSVDTTIVEYRRDRIEVSFIVLEGEASRVQTLSYSGFPLQNEPDRQRRFFISSPMTRQGIDDSTFYVNRQYNTQELKNEQERILTFLKNNGYASIERDSVIALVRPDAENPRLLDIQFKVYPGKVYTFGDVSISLADTKLPDVYSEERTLSGEPFTTDDKVIEMMKEPDSDTRFSLLNEQILFTAGETYNEELYLQTVKEYQNLGNLFIRRFGISETEDSLQVSADEIPVFFDLQTYTKHSISTELFGMKRYGYGTGFGIDYTNNNVFGKAERLTFGANASFEFVSSSTLDEIADSDTVQSSLFQSLELRTDYSIPRIAFPFAFLDNTRFFTSGLTRYSLSYSRSDQLYFDINSDVRFNYRYEVQHTDRFLSIFDLLELDVVDTNPSSEFDQSLRDEYGEDSFEYERIIQDFEPQVSSIIRYTFRSQNTNIIKRNRGYFSEYSISAGGNIPYVLDNYFITPGTVEGDLPSLFGISDNSLTYSRFVKITADYRRYIPISNSAVFAWRLYGGLAQPYGQSTSIPLNRRFFAGGSNDIRGWAPFQLGPGDLSTEDVSINGGEIKLAAYTEARQIFLRDVLSADWHAAWFVDAGNIWYGPRNDFDNVESDETSTSGLSLEDQLDQGLFKFNNFYNQIAVGTGLGLRLDWDYAVVRFDFAFRAHDLDVGWFNNRKLYFSFGIGHSF